MKPPKKPRSDSPLRMLPDERQAEIIAYLDKHSMEETRGWLAEDGMNVSLGALSRWRSDYLLREVYKQSDADAQTLMEMVKVEQPGISDEKLFEMGQKFFSLQAIKLQDSEMWARTRKEGTRKEALDILKRKFQRETCELFIQWLENKNAREIASGNLSHADKIETLGKTMFGEDW